MTRTTFEGARRELEKEYGELLERHGEAEEGWDLSEYADDPVAFVREVIGQDPWRGQVEIAEAVLEHPQVTVRSCHAAGKDWIAARLALWWCYARGGLVVLTGPTRQQVEEIMMRRELWQAWNRADLPGSLHVNALRPGGEGQAGVLAKTATGVSALTGFHDARVLFVITEAQDPEIEHAWDAAFACTTGAEDRVLTLGNPLAQEGRFYRAHRPGSGWKCLKIEAADIPNVREDQTVVPGLLTREGVDRFASEYGEDSGFYISRVLAEFPEQSEDGVFKREWLEGATERAEVGDLDWDASQAQPIAALDPARYGPDASVLAVRRGPKLVDLIRWEGRQDTMELVGRVGEELEAHEIEPEDLRMAEVLGPDRGEAKGKIVVDEVGVGGGVADRLRELGYDVEEFNGGRAPDDNRRYYNRRAEAFWELRGALEDEQVGLPDDERLFEELLALRWRPTSQGQVQLETKDDLKARLGRSPDRADAVAMCFIAEQPAGFALV